MPGQSESVRRYAHNMPSDNIASTCEQQALLINLIDRLTGSDGAHTTAIAPLTLHRLSEPNEPVYGVQKPTFCIVAQGCKQARLAEDIHLHDPSRYLLVSVDLPIRAQVVQASRQEPYLGFCLDIDLNEVGALMMDMDAAGTNAEMFASGSARSLSLSTTDNSLLNAVIRLLLLLDTPNDIPVLAPLAVREILYRLLTGEQGARLRQTCIENSLTQRVGRVIDWLKVHYAEPMRIETIAQEACMSPSGLHSHFKAVTAMSPLQYQKHLRLQEARRLMLYEAFNAETASYRVGYNSASQFNREYTRLFGNPPLRDIARMRGGL